MANKVIHKRSIKPGSMPTGSTLDFGEIAVNYNSSEPFLSIRTTVSGQTDITYAKFIDEAVIDTKLAKKADNEHTHTISASANDDDVVNLSGTSGIDGVTYTVSHAKKLGENKTYTSNNTTTSISGSGGTIKIPQITVDSYGHVTAADDESITITMPTIPITDTWNGNDSSTSVSQKGTTDLYNNIITIIEDNEEVIAASLINLDERISGLDSTYLPLSGGTMTGCIITPGNDSVVIKPSQNNYDQIGAENCTFWKVHSTYFHGLLKGTADNADALGGVAASNYLQTTSFTDGHMGWADNNLIGRLSPVDIAMSSIHSANRLAFGNPNGITIEYSQDGGTSWTTYSCTDEEKVNLVSGIENDKFTIGAKSSNITTNDMLRVTLVATDMGVYTSPRKLFLEISTDGAQGCYVKVEYSQKGTPTSFVHHGTFEITGWSGWNSIPIHIGTFGGNSEQLTNNGTIRLTFNISSVSSAFPSASSALRLKSIALHGETSWSAPSAMAKTGHLYDYDASKNATFPGVVTAMTFKKPDGTEVSYTDVSCNESGHYSPSTSATTVGTTTGNDYIRGIQVDSKNHVIGVSTGTPTNTTNTAGSSDSASKLYLVGADSQSSSGVQTYSNSAVYMEEGGLYANHLKVESLGISTDPYNVTFDGLGTLGVMLEDASMKTCATNSTDKLYLIGSAEQSLESQTKSNSAVYMQAGKLYANGSEVGTMETINSTVSALTASNVNLDSRISALENIDGISIAVGTDKTYLMGASSTTATTVNIQTGSTSSESGVWMSNGTITATKGFYQVSDEREKIFKNELDIDFDKLKTIPKSYFTWKGDEDKKLEIGTSAQKLKEVYPELVSYDSVDDRYTVSYDKLSIIALKAVDKLHEENEMLRAELDMIKKHIGL